MPTPKQRYINKLNAIAKRYASMEDQVLRRSVVMLQDLRAKVAAELSTAADFRAFHLRQLQRNIDRMITEYEAQMGAQIRSAFWQAYETGGLSATDPLREIGVKAAFFRPSRAQVNVILDFSADLVKDITAEVRQKINTQIRLAALGERPPIEAMRGITDALGVEARAGVWAKRPPVVKNVAARAETILRTELQRTFNLSSWSQQLALADVVEGLLKRWIATADSRTRRSHLDIHNRTRSAPVPIKEPFVLRDAKYGQAKLMYPGDPTGPPWCTINCRCTQGLIHPAIGVIGSSLDGRIVAELNRRAA